MKELEKLQAHYLSKKLSSGIMHLEGGCMKKIIVIISIIVLFLLIGVYVLYQTKLKPQITLKENVQIDINTEYKVKSLIKNYKNITITNLNKKLDTASLGNKKIVIKYKTKFGKKQKTTTVKIIDKEKPKIEYNKELETNQGSQIDLLKDVKVTDNSKEEIIPKVEGEYDFNKPGEYKLKYVAIDSSKNKTEEEFVLKVKEVKKIEATKKNPAPQTTNNKFPYYIKINRLQNVVMVYGLENGEYSKLVKTFVCSTGTATPTGTFKTTDKYTWRALVGGVYGQYATRITGSILFHSVPYFTQSKSNLEYEEYNKLGTKASKGCIRLSVIDSKWIYDNCPKGTTVTIYDSNSLDGITKPSPIKIDVNNPNKGWDPTDPDPNNPWKK